MLYVNNFSTFEKSFSGIMQFKNPEILYLLFLLLIPILIHLFQLQKFEKITFTNVKLLQQIEQQTRKSSKLKKRLILITRLLLFSCLIIAFAQPFFDSLEQVKKTETIIYLDNSLSMQAKGNSGELLQKAKTDLIASFQENESSVSLITNDKVLKNLTAASLKNELLKIDYYPVKKDLKTILLQINEIQNKHNTPKNVILISDFQMLNGSMEGLQLDSLNTYGFVQLTPKKVENIAIDSVWIVENNQDKIQIKSAIKSYNTAIENLSISLFINENLSGKTSVKLNKNTTEEIEFTIPYTDNFYGKLNMNDNTLLFDNNFYFSSGQKEKTKVLAIGENTVFLSKIYTIKDFDFTNKRLNNLDFSEITENEVVILNEIPSFSNALVNALKIILDKEGRLVIIPAENPDISSYNNLFYTLQIGEIIAKNTAEKLMTKINYGHPFFKNVFKNTIENFNYPTVNHSFDARLNRSSVLLEFADKSSFVSEISYKNTHIYWISSPLNNTVSNFTSSPLIVPLFYNFGLVNREQNQIYYTIGDENEILINLQNEKETILQITNKETSFIPLQTKSSDQIKIQIENNPLSAGIYQIYDKEKILQNIAFNYNRNESDLTYIEPEKWIKSYKNATYFSSVNSGIVRINDQNKKHNLWQLFIIFVLLFLGIEVLLQKFLKS